MAETIAEGLFSPDARGGAQLHASAWRRSPGPGLASVMVDAFNITQDRIARSRLAGDPPDVHLKPRLGKIGLFDFHRAEEVIRLGEEFGCTCDGRHRDRHGCADHERVTGSRA